jgi:hypothetical protein
MGKKSKQKSAENNKNYSFFPSRPLNFPKEREVPNPSQNEFLFCKDS